MLVNAEELAYGRWPDILQSAGVNSAFFNGKHGPCPFCPDGGTDRFRFQNTNGGRWICSQCTASKWCNGFDFLMRHMQYRSFKEAADHVRDHFGITQSDSPEKVMRIREALPPVPKEKAIDVPKVVQKMQRHWDTALVVTSGDPVDRYVRSRVPQLKDVPADIRFHPRMGYWDQPEVRGGDPIFRGYFAAMVVRGFNAAGELVQIHKTYLTPDGRKADVANQKKTDSGIGSNSFALRIGVPTGDTLGVCEGIETGLAASVLDGCPVWPCHSSSIMANFEVPLEFKGQVRKIIIYADSDPLKNGHRAGSEAAAKLAASLRTQGYRSLIVRPAKIGDFADLALQAA